MRPISRIFSTDISDMHDLSHLLVFRIYDRFYYSIVLRTGTDKQITYFHASQKFFLVFPAQTSPLQTFPIYGIITMYYVIVSAFHRT